MNPGIPLRVPARLRDLERGYLTVGVRTPMDETRIMTAGMPWRQRDTGEYQVHVSSIATLVAAGVVALPGSDGGAVTAVRRYAVEARRTYSHPDLTTAPPDAGLFLSVLSADYKPRPYQLAGMARLYARCTDPATAGCVLADDVGLGKTVQTIGAALRLFREGTLSHERPLVVVPTASTVTQWAAEFDRFARHPIKVSAVAGSGSAKSAALARSAAVYILGYETIRLPRYAALVQDLAERLGGLVLDESSAVANPESATHRAAKKLRANALFCLCLNATPIENALMDYYAQLRVLNERCVGEPEGFIGRYLRVVNGRVAETRHVQEFVTRTAGFYLRRTAEMVQEQLPPLTAQLRQVTMGPVQAAAYDAAIRQAFARTGAGVHSIQNVSAIQRAALIADLQNPTAPSAKLEDLCTLLRGELHQRRVLVFTRLATIAESAVRYLRHRQLDPLLVTGSTPPLERDRLLAAFAARPRGQPAVLVTTDALSKGRNIQAANVVVNLDLPWNPAKLRQRIGRSHRIGQESPVLVINYRARHPTRKRDVDQFFLTIMEKKQNLVDQVFVSDGIDTIGQATDADIATKALKYLGAKA